LANESCQQISTILDGASDGLAGVVAALSICRQHMVCQFPQVPKLFMQCCDEAWIVKGVPTTLPAALKRISEVWAKNDVMQG